MQAQTRKDGKLNKQPEAFSALPKKLEMCKEHSLLLESNVYENFFPNVNLPSITQFMAEASYPPFLFLYPTLYAFRHFQDAIFGLSFYNPFL